MLLFLYLNIQLCFCFSENYCLNHKVPTFNLSRIKSRSYKTIQSV